MKRIKYYILKTYYSILIKLKLHKAMTANEIKDNMFKNLESLSKPSNNDKEISEYLNQAQLKFMEERFTKLNKMNDENITPGKGFYQQYLEAKERGELKEYPEEIDLEYLTEIILNVIDLNGEKKMKKYKIYFELFGNKLSIFVEANSYEEAKRKFINELPDKIKFFDNVKREPTHLGNNDIFNNLWNIVNGKD